MITTAETDLFKYSGGDRIPAAVAVLGRGIEQDGTPSLGTINRANAVVDFFRRNDLDPDKVPIVASGSYSASLPEAPANNKTEAGVIRDIIVDAGLKVKGVEDRSTCTFTNFAYMVQEKHLRGVRFNRARPLALGTGYEHFLRGRLISQAAYNLSKEAVVNIAPPHEDGLLGRIKERGGILITHWALTGREQYPDGTVTYEGLMDAQRRFELVGPSALRAISHARAARATA